MGLEKDYPALDRLLGEIFEAIGDIKLALADGKVTVDEIIEVIPDGVVGKDALRDLLNALLALPEEVKKVVSGGPWRMLSLFQAIAGKVMALFK